jgi:hypothetical protein
MYLAPAPCKRGRVYKGERKNKLGPDARNEKIAEKSKAGIKLLEEQMRPQGE